MASGGQQDQRPWAPAARAAATEVAARPFAEREEETAACVPLVDMSCHGSDEQLVFKHELISFFYKNTCISTFVLIHVSNRILRRMGYIFAFSVIF